MPRISVGRYKDPNAVGYQGWIIPDEPDPEWNIFITVEGHVQLNVRKDGSLYFPQEPTA